MMKQFVLTLLALAVVLMPLAGVPSAAAQRQDSLIDVWVVHDEDLDGVFSGREHLFHDVGVCIVNNDTGWNHCGGTDYGDEWFEIDVAGNFSITVIAEDVGPGYKLNTIQCRETISYELYDGCTYDLENWKTDIDLPYGTRINIFYALVEADEIVVPEVWLQMFPMIGR